MKVIGSPGCKFTRTAGLCLLIAIVAPEFASALVNNGDPQRVLIVYKNSSVDKDGDGLGDSQQLV